MLCRSAALALAHFNRNALRDVVLCAAYRLWSNDVGLKSAIARLCKRDAFEMAILIDRTRAAARVILREARSVLLSLEK